MWADLLALAGDGQYGDEGEIRLRNNVGLTDEQICGILNVSAEEWSTSKARLLETERISVNSGNTIAIINWPKYQAEYSRQKSYRKKLPQ